MSTTSQSENDRVGTPAPAVRPRHRRRGFSLLELIVVLAITSVLAGLLFPVLAQVRQRVDRVISGNNLRTLGIGMAMYERDFAGELPRSSLLAEGGSPADLTVLFRPEQSLQFIDGLQETGWDGIGRLYGAGYVDQPRVLFSPNHQGQTLFEDYDPEFLNPGARRIYGSYHYAGHLDWITERPRRMTDPDLILASDGLRTLRGLNHRDGLNLLAGDGSVRFVSYPDEMLDVLTQPYETPEDLDVASRYRPLWSLLEATRRRSAGG